MFPTPAKPAIRSSQGICKRNGVKLARSTMCDWMATCADLLDPIVREMVRRIFSSQVIGTDDTPVKVQDHTGKGSKTGRLWAYLGDRDTPFVVDDDTPDRSANGPERFLAGSRSGYLQSDASAGSDGLHRRGLVEVGCWARARRKFHECRASDPERSHAAIAGIGRLYAVEREAKAERWDDARLLAAHPGRSRPALESVRGVAGWRGEEGAPEEPHRRGDRLCPVELGGVDAVSRIPVPLDR